MAEKDLKAVSAVPPKAYDPEPLSIFMAVVGAAGALAAVGSWVLQARDSRSKHKPSASDVAILKIDLDRLRTECDRLSGILTKTEVLLRAAKGNIGFDQAVAEFGKYQPLLRVDQFSEFQSLHTTTHQSLITANEIIFGILTRASDKKYEIGEQFTEMFGAIHQRLDAVRGHKGSLWSGMKTLRQAIIDLGALIAKLDANLGTGSATV